MKRFLAIAACTLAAASALSACDARDGKINRDGNAGTVAANTTISRNSRSSVTSSMITRDNDSHTDRGVLHDTASTIGEVGEDIADGADKVGSSVKSNINDVMDNENSDDM